MKDPLIVALDVGTLAEAEHFVKLLKNRVSLFKIGLRLFTAAGPDAVKMVHANGGKVFFDLKFHDIPNTVRTACESAAKLGVFMLNLHASGGEAMLMAGQQAVAKMKNPPLVLGVTVLTSEKGQSDTGSEVLRLAQLSKKCGLSGVVCSPNEANAVRQACGPGFVIVTPGIRPKGWQKGASEDQKRTATAIEAIQKGADYIVVGRPIIEAPDPIQMVEGLRAELGATE